MGIKVTEALKATKLTITTPAKEVRVMECKMEKGKRKKTAFVLLCPIRCCYESTAMTCRPAALQRSLSESYEPLGEWHARYREFQHPVMRRR